MEVEHLSFSTDALFYIKSKEPPMAKVAVKKNSWLSKDQWLFLAMIAPGMIFLVIFSYAPMFGLIMAFQDFVPARGFLGSKIVWFDNFKYILNLPKPSELFQN